MTTDPDLKTALKAARKGVDTVKSFRNEKLKIDYKGKHDLVTDADMETERAIIEMISAQFPEDEILAEESFKNLSFSERRLWIIDPIDGTTNFAYDFPIYCVSLALYEDGEAKVAVVIEVNREEVFTAVRGKGAWLNGNPISVSALEEPDTALVGTGFPYNDYSLVEEYITLLRNLIGKVQGIRRPGAATYDLCCVAAGRFQGFYEYSLKAWDVAAASLIIKEAGGVVTDWHGGDDWLFGERIVAGNKWIHQFLLDRIWESISEKNLQK